MADEINFGRFGPEAVHTVWEKVLARCHTDPEGATSSARTLLEAVCKHILDGMNVPYPETADLPALIKITTEQLSLAPSQHSEETLKRNLGAAANVVEGLGRRPPAKLSVRHAQLVANMAGTVATFLVETWKVQFEELLEDLEDSKGG
jgi:hypothetical protein